MEGVFARIGQETFLPDGSKIIVEELSGLRIDKNPSATSIHEAQHALAAILLGVGVYYMTNIPEGDSLGHTLFSHFNPVVAAAPHAMGSPGGGHDLMQIHESGTSVAAAIAAARNLLKGHENEMLALATALDERKKLGGSEMLAITRQADEEKREGKILLIRIISPDGKKETAHQARVLNDDYVIVPIEMPKPVNSNEPFKPKLPKAA
jgi:hypothetical protein